MKLYILPIERACNASCKFCITNFREMAKGGVLRLMDLTRTLDLEIENIESIEITGGGEPTLHPRIDEIIELCSNKNHTQMYTNGVNIHKITKLECLNYLCVSLAHFEEKENRRIMGIYPNLSVLRRLKIPLKFSLLLHNSGINSKDEMIGYLEWTKTERASCVVVRQLFTYNYGEKLNNEFVSSEELFRKMDIKDYSLTKHGNPIFDYKGMKVEFEYRSCACETKNLVLHADGQLYLGWTGEKYDINRE